MMSTSMGYGRTASILTQCRDHFLFGRRYGTTTSDSKVYELRRYLIKPALYQQYLKLTEEQMHTRVSVSKCFGFWTSEIGSNLNEVFHIWEYDSLQHRADVRLALSKNQAWLSEFVSNAVNMFENQSNSLCYIPSWFKNPSSAFGIKGIFELETLDLDTNKTKLWEKQIQTLVAGQNKSNLIGVWYSDIANRAQAHIMWRYDSYASRADNRTKALDTKVLLKQDMEKPDFIIKQSSCLLLPASWTLL